MRVSICIPTRNRPDMLSALLEAVHDLTVPDGIEVEILVGDNSTDDRSAAVCERFPAVDYLRNLGDIGAYGNFNSLLARATGDWVHLIADDDEVDGDYLVGVASALHDPKAVIVTGRVSFFGPLADWMSAAYADRLRRMGLLPGTRVAGPALINSALIHGCPLVFSTVLIHRRTALAAGLFSRRYRLQGDYELWLRLLGQGDAHFVDAPIGALRAYEDNELEKDPAASREFRIERTLIRLTALADHWQLLTPGVRRTLVEEVRRELPRVRAFARLGYSGDIAEGQLTSLIDRAQAQLDGAGIDVRLEPPAARVIGQQPRWMLSGLVRGAEALRERLQVPPDGGDIGEREPTALGLLAVTDGGDTDLA